PRGRDNMSEPNDAAALTDEQVAARRAGVLLQELLLADDYLEQRELLAAALSNYAEATVVKEKEECVKAVEAEAIEDCPGNWTDGALAPEDKAYNLAIKHAAAAIRKRGEK